MKLYRVEFDLPSFYNLSSPDREAVSSAFSSVVREWVSSLPNVTVETWKESYYGSNVVICDDSVLGEIMCGTHRFTDFKVAPESEQQATFSIKKVDLFFDQQRVEDQIRPLIERMELAALRLEKQAEEYGIDKPGWNERCQTPISGFHLHNANELKLVQDCCTDILQEQLDEGWRIIAVNVQEQRRPDYVLARYNSTYMNDRGRALR